MLTSLRRGLLAGAATTLILGGGAVLASSAGAATPGCTDVSGTDCGSWNAEVPNQPDLDVQGGGATVGNVLIVYTRSNHDKAEDFRVQAVDTTKLSLYATDKFTGSSWSTTVPNSATAGAVQIRYSPNGVPSTLCLSSVNPNGFASVQLRPCVTDSTKFNPYQTFQKKDTGNPGDGDFVTFTEVIHGHLLTDPRNDGSIGVKGARVQVKFAGSSSNIHTGQLWSQNGA